MLMKEKVFILKKVRYGDADLILHVLTPKGARLGLFARAALKSRKRFGGGVLEPTHYVNVLYDEKSGQSNQSLHTLKEASLLESFSGLRTDYQRLETALHFIQLVHDASHEGEVHAEEVFNLLGNALKAAETSQALPRLRLHFEIKLLAQHGVLAVSDEEAHYLRTSISDHEHMAPLDPDAERILQARVQRVLREYLETSRHPIS